MYPDFDEIDGFDWDAGNSIKSFLKHGITPQETESVFSNDPQFYSDAKHSRMEKRFMAFGMTESGKRIVTVFTIRMREGKVLIRPISSRPMNRKEKFEYEKEIAGI